MLAPGPFDIPDWVAPEKRDEYWSRIGPLMEKLRRQDPRTFDLRKNWRTVDKLLSIGLEYAQPRMTSGLVEWQRYMMKARKIMLAEMQADEPHIVEATRRQTEDTP